MDPTDHSYPLPPVELRGTKECLFIDQSTGIPRDVFHFDGCHCSITRSQWEHMSDLIALPKESLPKFPPCASQEDMFESVGRPMVDAVMEGFNASILAYGQTSSGKTFTMMGSANNEGLIPRIARAIMEEADRRTISASGGDAQPLASSMNSDVVPLARSSTNLPAAAFSASHGAGGNGNITGVLTRDYFIELSFFEIYNEAVLDLLHAGGSQQHRRRKVRVHPVMGVYVEGLTYEKVSSWSQCFRYLQRGLQLRHTAATKMNEVSSRSHAIFQLRLVQNDMTDIGPVQHRSNVYLADLAGSERIKLSAVEGERLKESAQINLSLTTLRRVIDALIQQSPTAAAGASGNGGPNGPSNRMVPYRESMLTWVLSESLGGNAKSCMVATLCPHPTYVEETYQTLQYAHRAKSIVNSVVKNEDQMAKVLRQLQDALAQATAHKNPQAAAVSIPGGVNPEVVTKLEDRIKQQDELIRGLREEQMLMITKYADLKDAYDSLKDEYETEVDSLVTAQNLNKSLTVKMNELNADVRRLQNAVVALEKQEAAATFTLSQKTTECERLAHHKSQSDLTVKRLEHDLQQAVDETTRQHAENEDITLKLERMHSRHGAEMQQLKQQREWDLTASLHMQRWLQNSLQLLWDISVSSRKVFLQSQVLHAACDWAKSCGEYCASLTKRANALESRLQDLEYVNQAQDKSLSQVAALYVNVREFVHCIEQRQHSAVAASALGASSPSAKNGGATTLAAMESTWTVAGILKALHCFCDTAKSNAAVSVRAELLASPPNHHKGRPSSSASNVAEKTRERSGGGTSRQASVSASPRPTHYQRSDGSPVQYLRSVGR
jgi:hypothetical protein